MNRETVVLSMAMKWNSTDRCHALFHPIKTFVHRAFVSDNGRNAVGPCPNCNHTVSVPPNGYIYAKSCTWCGCILQSPEPGVIHAYEREDGGFGDKIDETTTYENDE